MAKEELSPHSGHRKRMRDRFLRDGMDSLQDHEVLELLLFYAIARQDTNELAHRLINRFGSLSGVFDAPVEELKRVEGVGGTTAVFIKTYPEVFRRYTMDKKKKVRRLYSYEDVADYAKSYLIGRRREGILVVLLNANSQILFSDIVYEGSVNAAEIYFRDLIRLASSYDAVGVILAHNHPSGDCLPSREDIITTRMAAEALGKIDVTLVDHVIVAGDDCVSMATSHVLPEVQATCDRVIVINKGSIVADDTPENLSKKLTGEHKLVVRIDGREQEVYSTLRAIDGMIEVTKDGEKEPGVYEYTIEAKPDIDIRRPLFRAMAKRDFPILAIRNAELTLEDIFLQLTDENQNRTSVRSMLAEDTVLTEDSGADLKSVARAVVEAQNTETGSEDATENGGEDQ